MLFSGTNFPPEHDRAYLQHAVVQILDNLGLLFEICRLPRPRLTILSCTQCKTINYLNKTSNPND